MHDSVALAFVVSSLWVRSGFAFMGVGRRERGTGHPRTMTTWQGGETMVLEGEVMANVNRSDFFIWDVK